MLISPGRLASGVFGEICAGAAYSGGSGAAAAHPVGDPGGHGGARSREPPRSTTAGPVLDYAALLREVRRVGAAGLARGIGAATGSASASRPAPRSCTGHPRGAVHRGGLRARRRRRPGRAGRDWCGPRRGSAPSSARRAESARGRSRRRAPGRRRPGPRTTRGSSSPPGSTGKPKGVAVTHRSAAAFVDAEARLFLRGAARTAGPGARRPVGGLRRLLRGDVAGLAARRLPGARPALAGQDRARSSVTWLVQRRISVVSTVPTLAALWPAE